jgi:ribosomal protein S18 acetylase RimI-like enzyme
LQVRLVTSGDESQIIEMLREFMVFEKADLLTDSEFKDMFKTVIGQPDKTLFLIAETEGRAVGMTTMVFRFSTWQGKPIVTIDDVYVREESRHCGVAVALLNFAFEVAKGRGCARVDLITEIDNYPAQELYKKMGFTLVPRIPFTRPL